MTFDSWLDLHFRLEKLVRAEQSAVALCDAAAMASHTRHLYRSIKSQQYSVVAHCLSEADEIVHLLDEHAEKVSERQDALCKPLVISRYQINGDRYSVSKEFGDVVAIACDELVWRRDANVLPASPWTPRAGEKSTMKVLVVEPNQAPLITEIPCTLKGVQESVGGSIQVVFPFDDPVALVCDEESFFKELPFNRVIGKHAIRGTFFLCGHEVNTLIDIPDDLIEKYCDLLQP